MNPTRPLVALLVVTVLATATAGGLLRAGVGAGLLDVDAGLFGRAALFHAALMLSGFFGTVIAIERAVAVRQRWAFAAPALSGAGALTLLVGASGAAAWLSLAGAAVFVAVHAVVLKRQAMTHTRLLAVAALCWLFGNLLFAIGRGADAPAWWFAFLVLTVGAERLEMTRFAPQKPAAEPVLLGIVAALLTGAALSPWQAAAGGVVFGLALLALGIWFALFDVARRTVRAKGLPRYMALCLLAGYAWLAVGGLAWMGTALGCPGRDMALHALGLGFVFSMVMGHAPVILPAVAKVKLRFGARFYLPVAALHASLLLRLFGGAEAPALKALGAALNAVSVALFALVVVLSIASARRAARQAPALAPMGREQAEAALAARLAAARARRDGAAGH
ncbi:hypothetical protein CLD22_19395 [Rubrivivax gelatinosus]|nr:hypothetical protein [Rubrivivax gelatinosus]